MSTNTALIGADPECFVQSTNSRSGIEVVPAFGLFGGDKDKPIPMEDMGKGYFYLEDNAALEFNVPPCSSAEDFYVTIDRASSWLRENVLADKDMEFSQLNSITLTGKYQKDPRGKRVGCQPDFDAYLHNGAQREPFSGDTLGNKRYAGGHIHLAYNVDVIPAFVGARFCDIYLSLPYLAWDRQHDRRTTYGMAGLFRPKSYGVEYRTPSNWWVWQPGRTLIRFAQNALNFAQRTYEPDFIAKLSDAYAKFPWQDVQHAIKTEDDEMGRFLVDLANHTYGLEVRTP